MSEKLPVSMATSHLSKSELNPEGYNVPRANMRHSSVACTNNVDDWDCKNFGLPDDSTLLSLTDQYDLQGYKHILDYEYDMGDSWKHVILIEKRIPEAEVLALGIMKKGKGKKRTSTGKEKESQKEEYDKSRHWAKITGGSGHGVAEDCGSYPGWDNLIEAYQAKGTDNDKAYFKSRRSWYEKSCGNGDKKGLKGKQRLEHFDKKVANKRFEEDKLMGDGRYLGRPNRLQYWICVVSLVSYRIYSP